MEWIKLAFRNVLRNKRRSLVTLFAISIGFSAISLFHGYTNNMYSGIKTMAIRGEGLGHLTIFKTGWLKKGRFEPMNYMFSKEEMGNVIKTVSREPGVLLATPKINLSGIVSNGTISTIFLAQGVVPREDKIIKGDVADARPVKGKYLTDSIPYGIEMAQELAKILDLSPGEDGVVMAPTLDGQMNALDMKVLGVYDTGSEATNDKYMRFPFSFAQSLLNTDKVDRIVVLLKDTDITEAIRTTLKVKLDRLEIDTEIKTWNELSLMYSKVRKMIGTMFQCIFAIVLVIVVMSTVNTMGMAVLERTREIGTLRALGVKRRGVMLLFAFEGGLLGFLGSLLGIIFHTLVWFVLRDIHPSYVPPAASTEIPLVVDYVPVSLLLLTLWLVFLSMMAAIIPAYQAAKQNIVSSFGHI